MTIYEHLIALSGAGQKSLFLLIDPDKFDEQNIDLIQQNKSKISAILVGGSLTFEPIDDVIVTLQKTIDLPVIIFPGNAMQVSDSADAIFFLSLVSGRNPEFLIGNHVYAAPKIMRAGLEAIPVGYVLVESGETTCVEYVSNTKPIPRKKSDIAVATAMAAKLLGMKMIYLEAGSGADNHVPLHMIMAVKKAVDLPLIVGGGIRSSETINAIYRAGADFVVIGNHFENNPDFLRDL